MNTDRMKMVACALSALGCSVVTADTLVVPDEYGTIQAAIDAAQEGDEVVIQPGIYNETFNYNGKGITVRSADGPLTTRIDRGQTSGTVIYADGVPKGARLVGIGIYRSLEACIRMTGGTLEVDNCRFVNSTFGFVLESDASVSFKDTQMVSCSGGFINGGTSSFEGCGFRTNTGGLDFVSGAEVSIVNCQFTENTGVAVDASESTVAIVDSGFVRNLGGAIRMNGSTLDLSDSEFAENRVDVSGTAQGGAISMVSGSDGTWTGCSFVQNEAKGQFAFGGDVCLSSSSPTIQSSTFVDSRAYGYISENYGSHSAEARGGAVAVLGGSEPILTSCSFTGCRAYSYCQIYGSSGNTGNGYSRAFGGAIWVDQSTVNCAGANFSGCVAEASGDGDGSHGYLRTAAHGGALGLQDSTGTTIEGSEIQNCHVLRTPTGTQSTDESAIDGGALWCGSSDSWMIQECSFSGCSSGYGGALCIRDSVNIQMTSCDFENNVADTDGGALLLDNTEVIGINCSFVGNQAPHGLAVFAVAGVNTSLFAGCLFCGDRFDAITGPWIDKGGNIFDENCDQDCDGDGLPDGYEIANGLEVDCNGNELPDSCEAGGDCDEDGILDECAIADGASDCDGNGVPDDCQADCDADGTLDICAIADGATDCNTDGIPDSCQLASGELTDFNQDGTPDECQVLDFTGLESEIVLIEDRILDTMIPQTAVCYRLYATFDPDSVGAAQLLGVYGNAKNVMSIEAPLGFWQDGMGGNTSASVACDERVLFPDLRYDSWLTIERACASDNVLIDAGIDWTDFNSGGSLVIPDGGVFLQPDDAQAIVGLEGRMLIAQVTSTDGSLPTGAVNLIGQNTDGSDWQAFGITWPEPPLVDCNGNGIHDAYDLSTGFSRDCDGSGIPDECEYDTTNDCNNNGIDDLCDVADGTSGDADGDFVPDECECQGDATRDGIVNVDDIIAVILAWGTNDPDADVDDSGLVDGEDLILVLGGYGACL